MVNSKPHLILPPMLPPELSDAQQACVDLLAEALAEAKRGKINSIGIIACMKSGYATVMAGNQATELYMGCGSLQKKILEAVEEDNKRTRLS